jgi:response regulator NasT
MPKIRILIADDEAVIRLGLRTMLEEHKYEVVGEASDGLRVIDLVAKLQPDLVLLDIKMPRIDGLAVARSLLADRAVPVIILTAYGDRELVDHAKEAGVLAYLVKPLRESDLTPTIEVAMSRFRELQALRGEIGNLNEALQTRKAVERAKGILMRVHGIDEAAAFGRIQRESRDSHRTMKEIAEEIILANPPQR